MGRTSVENPKLPDDEPENEVLTFEANTDEVGTRLDAYLTTHIPGWSRARLQRLIENGEALVNNRAVKPSYKVSANDQIEVELSSAPENNFTAEDLPLDITYEDDDIVVVNKRAGMVVHPAAGIHSGTLANALAYHFQQLAKSSSIRPGIVHRLDRDTSGLLVVAKTETAHQHLGDQFRNRKVFKCYQALVYGVLKQQSGRVEQAIARDPRNRTRMAVVAGGRAALSLYKVRRSYRGFTLLDVELKTGRTHQIRVHLGWLKHPVVGDDVYGSGRDNNIQDAQLRARIRKLNRQFLHAAQLGFYHPRTEQWVEFQAPLPTELSELLTFLEARAND